MLLWPIRTIGSKAQEHLSSDYRYTYTEVHIGKVFWGPAFCLFEIRLQSSCMRVMKLSQTQGSHQLLRINFSVSYESLSQRQEYFSHWVPALGPPLLLCNRKYHSLAHCRMKELSYPFYMSFESDCSQTWCPLELCKGCPDHLAHLRRCHLPPYRHRCHCIEKHCWRRFSCLSHHTSHTYHLGHSPGCVPHSHSIRQILAPSFPAFLWLRGMLHPCPSDMLWKYQQIVLCSSGTNARSGMPNFPRLAWNLHPARYPLDASVNWGYTICTLILTPCAKAAGNVSTRLTMIFKHKLV